MTENSDYENFEEEEYDDELSPPPFVVPSNLNEDDAEISYYAKKLGIDTDVNEWDDYMVQTGLSSILDGITAGRTKREDKKEEKMVEAKRTAEEEAARRDFTALLNRVAPSNFASTAAKLRTAFASHDHSISVAQMTRCITQRIFSDAILPHMFIDVYARCLKETPEAIPSVIKLLKNSPQNNSKNVKNFINQMGKDAEIEAADEKTVDSEVKSLAKIARRLNMTTDVRRGVFYALMNAVDVTDAVVRIAKLQLSKTMRKDVPVVAMECSRNEKPFNPFYAEVVASLVNMDKHYVNALRSALRNSMELAPNFDVSHIQSDASFISRLIRSGTANIGFLRGYKLPRLQSKQQFLVILTMKELFESFDETEADDFITELEKAPNFAADIGKFIELCVIPFVKKHKKMSPEKIHLMSSSAEKLTRLQ